jgi:hypothetical protein
LIGFLGQITLLGFAKVASKKRVRRSGDRDILVFTCDMAMATKKKVK